MTGFARVRRALDEGEVVVSLKSVNHRGLDLRFHLTAELDPFENQMRSVLTRGLGRGHVDVRVSLNRLDAADSIGLNRPMMDAYVKAFRAAATEHGIEAQPDLSVALRTPGMLAEPVDQQLNEQFGNHLLETLEEAVATLTSFRQREGAQLADEIRPRVKAIHQAAVSMEQIRTVALPHFQARLRDRLAEILEGITLEPQRLAQEAAILADRSDIGEELARLKIHSSQLAEILDAGGELGKRVDFLAQEMHREANTILSKTNGIGEQGLEITDLALGVKAEIEKIREQSLNLE
ncbi:MAG: YicC family protein [bacterium]|nr:YicC family protein [bacterium]